MADKSYYTTYVFWLDTSLIEDDQNALTNIIGKQQKNQEKKEA